jgi:hypothetical protein
MKGKRNLTELVVTLDGLYFLHILLSTSSQDINNLNGFGY